MKKSSTLFMNLAQLIHNVIRSHITAKYNIEDDYDLHVLLQDDNIFVPAVDQIVADRSLVTYCEQHLGLVKPVASKINDTQETFQYVPILSLLQKNRKAGGVWENMTRDRKDNPELLEVFDDGNICKQHELFSTDRLALRIHLYTDEFEICNPIGPKRKKHKICAFYYVIGNLHPKYRSHLKHIHLALLVRHRFVTCPFSYLLC